jgi:hypothetical protein
VKIASAIARSLLNKGNADLFRAALVLTAACLEGEIQNKDAAAALR